MNIGYARVSTLEQNLDLQVNALKQAGCEKIITDQVSGVSSERPGLNSLKEILRAGDTLVVWRLDRLGRSVLHLAQWTQELSEQGIGFKSLQESIDSTTPAGRLMLHFFAAVAEFERDIIRERTLAGLKAARARGRRGGRPKKLNAKQRKVAVDLYHSKEHTIKEICEIVEIASPITLYKYVKEVDGQGGS